MRWSALSSAVLLAACSRAVPSSGTLPATAPAAAADRVPRIAAGWALAGRARAVRAAHAMVVTDHPLASEVGLDILRRGGNAVDAAAAVGFALAVVHPVAGNLGGGGFMMIRLHDGTVAALDYRETAPARARRDMYVDSAGNVTAASLTGHLAVGVPGSVAGLYEAQRRFGRLPWRAVVAPAIRLAKEGHTVDAVRSRELALDAERLARFPASRAQFLVDGRAPPPGARLVQAELARTLELIADSGPAAFYRGSIADLIVAEMERGGGLITKADLARYRAKWREPVRIAYRGHTVLTMPPPSGGGVTLAELLNVMEGYRPLPPFGSAALLHLEVEAMRRAYTDRNRYLGDPDFVDMPLGRLLSKAYAAELRDGIDPRRATPTPPAAGIRSEGTETTHYSIVDAAGNAVSCTTTLNNDFGSAVTVAGAGFLLNDEMDDFTAAPGKPNLYGLVQGEANAIAPGKRMLSAMTPTIVLDPDGRVLLVLGSPGGSRITTAVFQVLSNVIDHGLSLADAVAAPRVHHQGLPDVVYLERGGFLPAVIDSLEAMGHAVTQWGYKTDITAIERTAAGWVGVADPRRGGGAVGY
jgi:gamma-glutamyltranspeptidase/glutathione hydrolase